jgi:hypothetical protein
MRQSITQFVKCILRIAIFSLGGLLTIIGIISGSYALVQLPDGASKFMPCVVSALLTLPAGIYLCFLAIKVPHYLAESRKMSKEEKVIKNIKTYMKKRKQLVAALTFLLVMTLSFLIWTLWNSNKLDEMITPKQIRTMASFDNPKRELPILFSRFYALASLRAKLLFQALIFSASTGFVIAMLIIEISGLNRDRHRLTLSMWERIQQLESEVKGLKAHTQADSQQIDGMDGGDAVVN